MKELLGRWFAWMDARRRGLFLDVGLLLLRVSFGFFMIYGHGLRKMNKFEVLTQKFADPLGVGRTTSLVLAIGAEVFCSAALILGIGTRLVLVPLIFTMVVAAFVVHGVHPFAKKEMALLYLHVYVFLLFAGAGRFSVDGWLSRRWQS